MHHLFVRPQLATAERSVVSAALKNVSFLCMRALTYPQHAVNLAKPYHCPNPFSGNTVTLGFTEIAVVIGALVESTTFSKFDLSIATCLLVMLYTAARPGSVISTDDYPLDFLKWKHVRLLSRVVNGLVVGCQAIVNLTAFKGHHFTDRLE